MKYVLTALILLGLFCSLAGDSTNVNMGVKPSPETGKSPTGQVLKEFGAMMKWFIIALLGITLYSAVRIYLLNRKRNKGQGPEPKTGKTGPDRQPGTRPLQPGPIRPRKAAVSYPYIIIMVLLGLLFLYSWLGNKNQIQETSYTDFMAQLKTGQVKHVEFTDRDMIFLGSGAKYYHTMLPTGRSHPRATNAGQGRQGRNQETLALAGGTFLAGADHHLRSALVLFAAGYEQPEFQGFQLRQEPRPDARGQ